MDVVTTASVFGYESAETEGVGGEKEKVILPDTSQFLHPSLEVKILFWLRSLHSWPLVTGLASAGL